MDGRTHYRSLFWPILLIGIGVIWLLVNLGFISAAGLNLLFNLWPLILIAFGLDLLFGRRSPLIGALIGLVTLAVIVALLVAAPLLPLANTPEVKTENFSEPVEETTTAGVSLDLWSDPATVGSLAGSSNLIEVEATHTGQVNFEVSGGQEKTVRLSHSSSGVPSFFFDLGGAQHTDIRLNPEVPTDLDINIGSGSADLDLRELSLTRLVVDGGSGSAEVTLPSGGEGGGGLESTIRSGSGSFNLTVPEEAQGELRLDTGSGSVVVDIPEGAPARVEVRDSGSGSVNIAAGLQEVSRGEDDEGVWETPGYSSASGGKILIIFEDIGSGSVRVQ